LYWTNIWVKVSSERIDNLLMPNPAKNTQGDLLGQQLIAALTEPEIGHLLEALLAVLPPDLRHRALEQLQPDTRQTVQQLLAGPPVSSRPEASAETPVSIAKLAQTWASLWQEWDKVVREAAQEEGDYITQEAHWEPPYFDETGFITDLEEIARKMRPLVQAAVEHSFSPGIGFAEALATAEEDVVAALPEWIYLEGLSLEENLTTCLLEWEWLQFKEEEEEDTFAFANFLLELQDNFSHISLDSNAYLDFLTHLPERDRQDLFNALTQQREMPPWKELLSTPYSPWYAFYLDCIEQYAPERYLDVLRGTIPQQWQNGLPVIEDLLAKKEYHESLAIIHDTLLVVAVPQYADTTPLEDHRQLLTYYRQTAQGLDQTELANVLKLQLIAFEHRFNWAAMLSAFAEAPVAPPARQALFESWRSDIIQKAKPRMWSYGWTQPTDSWWLHWLIDSLSDEQKGAAWFQQKISAWLAQLPGDRRALGEDFHFLRLLTHDLSEISGQYRQQYPQFFQVVIRPGGLSTPDQASRQTYLKQSAPPDLPERVMAYWQTHLQHLAPRPEEAQKSDYTVHAQWLAALRELSLPGYEAILKQWQVEHHRRRNLWAALARLGLI
jgi:hypothetical protein